MRARTVGRERDVAPRDQQRRHARQRPSEYKRRTRQRGTNEQPNRQHSSNQRNEPTSSSTQVATTSNTSQPASNLRSRRLERRPVTYDDQRRQSTQQTDGRPPLRTQADTRRAENEK